MLKEYNKLEEMTELESRLFYLIPIGTYRTISTRELATLLDVSKRTIQDLVYRLIVSYGVPICAYRQGNQTGYFIPSDEEERRQGLQAYLNQVETMTQRVADVTQADIERVLDFKESGRDGK